MATLCRIPLKQQSDSSLTLRNIIGETTMSNATSILSSPFRAIAMRAFVETHLVDGTAFVQQHDDDAVEEEFYRLKALLEE